jgi:hypothetical protein
VWKKAIDKINYKLKLIREERFINIKIAKAYRSVERNTLHTDRIDPHRHKNGGGNSIL